MRDAKLQESNNCNSLFKEDFNFPDLKQKNATSDGRAPSKTQTWYKVVFFNNKSEMVLLENEL